MRPFALVVYTDIGTDPDDVMALLYLMQQPVIEIAAVVVTGENVSRKFQLVRLIAKQFSKNVNIFFGAEKTQEHTFGIYHNQCTAYQTLFAVHQIQPENPNAENNIVALQKYIAAYHKKIRHLSIAPTTDLADILSDSDCVKNTIDVVAQGGFRFDNNGYPVSLGNNWFADLPAFDRVRRKSKEANLPMIVVNSSLKEQYHFAFDDTELSALNHLSKTKLGQALIQDFKNWQFYTANKGAHPRPIILSDPLAAYFSIHDIGDMLAQGELRYIEISALKSESAWQGMTYRNQTVSELFDVKPVATSRESNLSVIRALYYPEKIKLHIFTTLFSCILDFSNKAMQEATQVPQTFAMAIDAAANLLTIKGRGVKMRFRENNKQPVYFLNLRSAKFSENAKETTPDNEPRVDYGAGMIRAIRVNSPDKTPEENLRFIVGHRFGIRWNVCLGGKVESGETYWQTATREAHEEMFFALKDALLSTRVFDGINDETFLSLLNALKAHLHSSDFQLLQTKPEDLDIQFVVDRRVIWKPNPSVDHLFQRRTFCCIDPVTYSEELLERTMKSMAFIADKCFALRARLVALGYQINTPQLEFISAFAEAKAYRAFTMLELKASIEAWNKPDGLFEELQDDAQLASQPFHRFETMVLREWFYQMNVMSCPATYLTFFDVRDLHPHPEVVALPDNSAFLRVSENVVIPLVSAGIWRLPSNPQLQAQQLLLRPCN